MKFLIWKLALILENNKKESKDSITLEVFLNRTIFCVFNKIWQTCISIHKSLTPKIQIIYIYIYIQYMYTYIKWLCIYTYIFVYVYIYVSMYIFVNLYSIILAYYIIKINISDFFFFFIKVWVQLTIRSKLDMSGTWYGKREKQLETEKFK
jgi:hypothetical protein